MLIRYSLVYCFCLETKKDILNYIANSREYRDICIKICQGHKLHQDLFSELFLILNDIEEVKIVSLYEKKELKFFIIKIFQNQFNSSTSPFFKKYKKFNSLSQEIEGIEVRQEEEFTNKKELQDILIERDYFTDKHDWYKHNLLIAYLKAGNLRTLEAKTGINIDSIWRTIKDYKKDLAKKIKDFQMVEGLLYLKEEDKIKVFKSYINSDMTIEEVISVVNLKNKVCLKQRCIS